MEPALSATPLSAAQSSQVAQSSADAPAAPYGRRWLMLPVVLIAMFMTQFDLYVVNVALPLLQHDLQAGQGALELIVGGYAFVYASGLITGGRLGDLFSYRRLFLAGMVAFAVASLLCGLSDSPGQLVAARLLQGLTAAAMVPQVLALITAVFPPAERARSLSWFGVTMGVGAVAGQVLGGVLLNLNVFGLGWRVIFFVNVPVALATLVLAYRLLPRLRGTHRPKLDPLGALGISGSLALVLVPLTLGRTEGWPAWTFICLAASAPAMAVSLRWEQILARRGGQPLLNLELFADLAFDQGLVINVAVFARSSHSSFPSRSSYRTASGSAHSKRGSRSRPRCSLTSPRPRRLSDEHPAETNQEIGPGSAEAVWSR